MFRFFRRYQKTFIVVGGVILMFVFTVGDSLTAWMQSRENSGSQRSPNATAVTWEDGKLTEGELDTLRNNRRLVWRFVQSVYRSGMELAAMAGLDAFQDRVQPIGFINSRWTNSTFEEELLLTHILAERGRQLGIQISDNAVSEYISELGRGQLDSDEIRAILASLNPNGPSPTPDVIYDALRHELLAAAVARSYGVGSTSQDMFSAELPVNRWEEWKRMNDRIVVEAAAIDPATSIIDVPEPTDKQIKEFYEEFKDRTDFPVNVGGVQLPTSAPGFAVPPKVKLRYLRANYQEYVDRFAKEVTDEQIAEYYEENKDPMFEEASFDDVLGDDDDDSEGDDASNEQDAASETSDEDAVTDEVNSEAESTEDNTTEDETTETAASEEPSSETPEQEVGDSEAGDGAEEDVEEVEEAAAPSNGEQSAIGSRRSPFRLVALQESTVAESDQSETDEAETGEAADDGELDNRDSDDESEEPKKFQPLEEVEDKIRQRLAEARFFSEIDQIMQSAAARLNPAFSKYLSNKMDAESRKEEPPAPPAELLDLAPLAEEFDLEFEETAELDAIELRDTPVGKSIGVEKYSDSSVLQMMMSGQVDMFEPVITADIGGFGDRYLVMKTSEETRRVPELKEIRDQVVAAWKRAEAAKLALDKAESTAKEVQESGLSLKDFFDDQSNVEVTTTPPFTNFTEGDIAPATGQPTFRLSQPEGLENVGPDFLEEVFKLESGDVKALLNFDKSIVYVVRIADSYESTEQLRSDFLEQANFWRGRGVFQANNTRRARQAALQAMLEDINVEWQRGDEEPEDDESDNEEDQDEQS